MVQKPLKANGSCVSHIPSKCCFSPLQTAPDPEELLLNQSYFQKAPATALLCKKSWNHASNTVPLSMHWAAVQASRIPKFWTVTEIELLHLSFEGSSQQDLWSQHTTVPKAMTYLPTQLPRGQEMCWSLVGEDHEDWPGGHVHLFLNGDCLLVDWAAPDAIPCLPFAFGQISKRLSWIKLTINKGMRERVTCLLSFNGGLATKELSSMGEAANIPEQAACYKMLLTLQKILLGDKPLIRVQGNWQSNCYCLKKITYIHRSRHLAVSVEQPNNSTKKKKSFLCNAFFCERQIIFQSFPGAQSNRSTVEEIT